VSAKGIRSDVNVADNDGATPLYVAAQWGNLDEVRYLVEEFGAGINQSLPDGSTSLLVAVRQGHLGVVRFLISNGADVNKARNDGATPLLIVSTNKYADIVKWLVKACADPSSTCEFGAAADLSQQFGASVEQTAYLEAKARYSHPGCIAQRLKKCTGCSQSRYCEEKCRLVHWPTHKAEWKRLKAGKVHGCK
jgi:hypothetical protein